MKYIIKKKTLWFFYPGNDKHNCYLKVLQAHVHEIFSKEYIL